MTEWFVSHPIAAGALAEVIHAADFVLTLVGHSMYQRVSEHISYENYELIPFFRKTITERRWLSRRFITGSHLANIVLFRRLRIRGLPSTGCTHLDFRTSLHMAMSRAGTWTVVLGLAALLTYDGWLTGGWLGCCLLTLSAWIWSLRRPKPSGP